MSFGREAMKKTLKELKEKFNLQFNVFEGIMKDVDTTMDRIDQLLTDAMGKPAPKMVSCLGEIGQEYGRIIKNLNRGFLTIFIALTSYTSALENYSLEFDKTWDDLTKRAEKATKKVEKKTEQLKKKDFSYIG